MKIDAETARGFGIALNEATLLGAEYDPERNLLGTTFSVLALPGEGIREPADPRVQILFSDVGRVAAALRNARWDDREAETVPFQISDLPEVIQSLGGQPVYGWEFVNVDDTEFHHWERRLSLDFRPPGGSTDNRINLFQERSEPEQHLDLWIWFSEIRLLSPKGDRIKMDDFIAGGDRWWTALFAGDDRTSGHGIVRLDGDS